MTRSGQTTANLGPSAAPSPWGIYAAAAVLVAAATVAYHNTFSAPFIFDDLPSIAQNASIRDFQRPAELLMPAAMGGAGVAGRPMVNLSLALNRALGGEAVQGYHAFNLLVHIAAGLVLFGVVRRTLELGSRPISASTTSDSLPVAFFVALLWLVHPLQTESVTCIIQRTESLAGLFYLGTFYCFVRSLTAANPCGWSVACWLSCLAGAATKELVATAPVLLLLYDRTFVAGSFRAAWQRRGRLYLALLASWVVVAALVWRSDTRGGTVGFGHGVAAWEYLLTQCRALAIYLKLAFWPHPLVLDYGAEVVREPARVWAQGLFVLALLGATAWALVRRPRAGFLGAWFFVILAPSSSFVPLVTQTIAEHRMYLPLVALVVPVVFGLRWLTARQWRGVAAFLAVALVGATVARNADYRTAETIWHDSLAKWPTNARAHSTLAQLADDAGRTDEAIAHGDAAVRLQPGEASHHFNLAFSFAQAGRLEDALRHYEEAARLKPASVDAHINAGAALVRLGRVEEAIAKYETVVRLKPKSAEDEFNLAQVYFLAGRTAEAVTRYEAALALKPDMPEAHHRLGNAYVKSQRLRDAVAAYREAVRLAPGHFEAHVNLAGACMMLNLPAEAVPLYERALQLRPGDPVVTGHLAFARAQLGR